MIEVTEGITIKKQRITVNVKQRTTFCERIVNLVDFRIHGKRKLMFVKPVCHNVSVTELI